VGVARPQSVEGSGLHPPWGKIFFFPPQTLLTRPPPPPPRTIGTRGYFSGVKRPQRGAGHPPHPMPRLRMSTAKLPNPPRAFMDTLKGKVYI